MVSENVKIIVCRIIMIHRVLLGIYNVFYVVLSLSKDSDRQFLDGKLMLFSSFYFLLITMTVNRKYSSIKELDAYANLLI